MNKLGTKSLLAPAIAAGLIIAAFVQGSLQPSPSDAEGYHLAITQAMNRVPTNVGDWEGQDVEIPDGSLQLLRPNLARSRVYTRGEDEAIAHLLLIQCKDARDLAGHYPLNCYPNVYGYKLAKSSATNWSLDGLLVHGRTYVFNVNEQPGSGSIVVQQFFALPDGTTTDDVDAIYRLAGDYTQRHRGAAQVQVVYPANDPHTDEQREAIFTQLVGSYTEVIRLILADNSDRTEAMR
ncbi:MAG: exosortase-associated EpsI family protein [Planctomycetota bacterium]